MRPPAPKSTGIWAAPLTTWWRGAGSGGAYTGILRYLKEQKPTIRGVLADPVGSTIGGGEHADYDIEGIGNDFIPQTMDISLVDQVIKITDDDAFSGSRLLASREGDLRRQQQRRAQRGAEADPLRGHRTHRGGAAGPGRPVFQQKPI